MRIFVAQLPCLRSPPPPHLLAQTSHSLGTRTLRVSPEEREREREVETHFPRSKFNFQNRARHASTIPRLTRALDHVAFLLNFGFVIRNRRLVFANAELFETKLNLFAR